MRSSEIWINIQSDLNIYFKIGVCAPLNTEEKSNRETKMKTEIKIVEKLDSLVLILLKAVFHYLQK